MPAPLDAHQDRHYQVAEAELSWLRSLRKEQHTRKQNEKFALSPKTKATVDSGFVDQDDIATLWDHMVASSHVRGHVRGGSKLNRVQSPQTFPHSSLIKLEPASDRDYLSAEAELAAYRARQIAIAARLQDASGDRWGYADAEAELAAFRQQVCTAAAAPLPNSENHVNYFKEDTFQGNNGVDARDVYNGEVDLGPFRAKADADADAAAMPCEHNVDRLSYEAAAVELAQFRAGASAGSADATLHREEETEKESHTTTTPATSVESFAGEQSFVDSRSFHDAEAELNLFRAKKAALQDGAVDRNYLSAGAELAEYRAKQLNFAECLVDSRSFHDAEAELNLFRAKRAALQDCAVDRNYLSAGAELAEYRAKQLNFAAPTQDSPLQTLMATTAVTPSLARTEVAEVPACFIDARNCYGAEVELAAFRTKQMLL